MSLRSALTVILVSLFLLGTAQSCVSRKEPPPPPPSDPQTFGKWRQQADAYAKHLKTTYRRDSDEYKEAERRYIGAEARINRLIDRMLIDFANGVEIASPEVFDNTLEVACAKAAAFMAYLGSLSNAKDSGSVPEAGVDCKALKQESLLLWNDYRTANAARRDAIQSMLRALKWIPFEDL